MPRMHLRGCINYIAPRAVRGLTITQHSTETDSTPSAALVA